MIKKISNSYFTLKERGILILFFAILNNLKLYLLLLLRRKYFKKKIYNNTMFLFNDDPGISKTLILFGSRELEHKYILEKTLKKK